MFQRLSQTLTHTWDRANAAASDLVTPAVRLGITGLARSGKTVFITSLVHNLLHRGRMPFCDAAAQGRLLNVYLEPQPDDTVPRFDYESYLAKLTAAEPQWPESTRAISQLRLTLEFAPIGAFWRALGTRRLHLDIVDYPGEWLLDLPLLNLSFEEWSRQAMASAREPYRQDAARDWMAFITTVDPSAPYDEEIARRGAGLFTHYLALCRQDELSLSSLTPGRFLMPGDLAGSPAVTFFPLEAGRARVAGRDSLGAMMTRRFQSYKTYIVRPFFRDHFARLDRQIVLADVLSVLNAGPKAVIDLERALGSILTCFNHGDNDWLSVLTGRKINRLVFAATKADHLHSMNHDRLEAILHRITAKSMERATFAGADTVAFALGSVRATRDADVKQNGDILHCIAGFPARGERLDGKTFSGMEELAIFPGDLPLNPDDALAKDWLRDGTSPLHFVRFRPPNAQAPAFGMAPALPHIRLDRALNFILADKLS